MANPDGPYSALQIKFFYVKQVIFHERIKIENSICLITKSSEYRLSSENSLCWGSEISFMPRN